MGIMRQVGNLFGSISHGWSVLQKGKRNLIVRFRSRPPDAGTRNERPVRVEPPPFRGEDGKVQNRRSAAGG
jgi:hypothetical protein